MNNFEFSVPTKVLFGKKQLEKLPDYMKSKGKKVLLVYGFESIKKNGLYDRVYSCLHDFEIYELNKVTPNPRLDKVKEGVAICKKENIDMILAVGGGSCVDCAKGIAAGSKYDGDTWDLLSSKVKIEKALPLFTVISVSATGSETNNTGVVTNMDSKQKLGFKADCLTPIVSVLEPENVYSLNAYHSACGVADIMSHLFEIYFNHTQGAYVQENLAHSLMKTCIKYAPVVLDDPCNYEARANIMWASSLALNGLVAAGFGGVWSCHAMEHVLSAYYDVAHGAGLAILTPSWMRYVLDETTIDRFVLLGTQVWEIDETLSKEEIANQAIDKTEHFFTNVLQLPKTLRELGIEESKLLEMAQSAIRDKKGQISGFKTLLVEDVLAIYKMCYD